MPGLDQTIPLLVNSLSGALDRTHFDRQSGRPEIAPGGSSGASGGLGVEEVAQETLETPRGGAEVRSVAYSRLRPIFLMRKSKVVGLTPSSSEAP